MENEDFSKLTQVSPKLTNKLLSDALTKWFREPFTFTHWESTKKISDPFINCATLFLSYSDGENDVICLEDANIYGFGPAVRQKGVDLDHCEAIFKTLAKFHAMSFVLKDQKPEEFNAICNHLFETYYSDKLWSWYEHFWKILCDIAIDAVEKEYPNSIYIEKVKKFATPDMYKELIKAAQTYQTGVITHGDTWTNNFLFKYADGKAVDTKMIDFQLSRCASPVLDLSFVFFACTTSELRDNHYDELLKYYHDVLSTQINEMGSDPEVVYSWESFMDEVKKYSFFGLAFSFESTPFIVLPPEEAFDMNMQGEEKLNIADVWKVKPFKTKEGRLREANNVKFCVDKGYI